MHLHLNVRASCPLSGAFNSYATAAARSPCLSLPLRARRYFGQLFVEWCEDTEWRKKMREDADKKSQAGVDGKVDESKAARKREEERTAGGSTKKKK